MVNFKLMIIANFCGICLTSISDAPKQQFIQIIYTGISESGAPEALFMVTQPVDTTTINDRLNYLKLQIDPQQANSNHISNNEMKSLLFHGFFRIMITDQKTFSETAKFILNNKNKYINDRHTNFSVAVNASEYTVGEKQQTKFSVSLTRDMIKNKCDTVVIKTLKRYTYYVTGKEVL